MAQNSEVINYEAQSENRITLATKWVNGTPFLLKANGTEYYLVINDLKKRAGSDEKYLFEATSILIEPPEGGQIRDRFKYKGFFNSLTKTGWIELVD